MPSETPNRADMRALALADYIAKVVADWPPLTDEQKIQLAALLRSE